MNYFDVIPNDVLRYMLWWTANYSYGYEVLRLVCKRFKEMIQLDKIPQFGKDYKKYFMRSMYSIKLDNSFQSYTIYFEFMWDFNRILFVLTHQHIFPLSGYKQNACYQTVTEHFDKIQKGILKYNPKIPQKKLPSVRFYNIIDLIFTFNENMPIKSIPSVCIQLGSTMEHSFIDIKKYIRSLQMQVWHENYSTIGRLKNFLVSPKFLHM